MENAPKRQTEKEHIAIIIASYTPFTMILKEEVMNWR